jgi:alcohol dehydrogenase, propanol-preferring
MLAMVLERPGTRLQAIQMPIPEPGPGEVRVKVLACAVCRTDLHVVDGELPEPKLPLIPGHEVVGEIVELGPGVSRFQIGDRVGVPWLGRTCGVCEYCRSHQENLCESALFTGYTRDGGYAEYAVADQGYCFPMPIEYKRPEEAAPLLCAGLIGYRSLVKAGPAARRLGIYGFGAAAHLIAQVARYEGREIYAFTRSGDSRGQAFARRLGATWAGASEEMPPVALDAAIIFAPVGSLVPLALRAVRKGGVVVCGGIHMSDIPQFPYAELWGERTITSVANLTRRDAAEFLALAPKAGLRSEVQCFPLPAANEALESLREGRLDGAAVLIPE